MFSDPQFWVAIAFIIFILAIFKPVKKLLTSSLDTKIKEIKDSINEAENLKSETLAILSNIKKRQSEVEIEIEEIKSNADNKIKIIEKQASEKLTEKITKRELVVKTKIDQMVRDVKLEVQTQISQTAIEATISVLEKQLNKEEKQNLINQSIKDFGLALKS
jgi:F-type H+-transporting ATPase subunit b